MPGGDSNSTARSTAQLRMLPAWSEPTRPPGIQQAVSDAPSPCIQLRHSLQNDSGECSQPGGTGGGATPPVAGPKGTHPFLLHLLPGTLAEGSQAARVWLCNLTTCVRVPPRGQAPARASTSAGKSTCTNRNPLESRETVSFLLFTLLSLIVDWG